MSQDQIRVINDLLLELARIAKERGSSQRVRMMYAKHYNRNLQRGRA